MKTANRIQKLAGLTLIAFAAINFWFGQSWAGVSCQICGTVMLMMAD